MKFQSVVADPPWPYRDPGEFTSGGTPIARGSGSVARYGSMKLDEMMDLDVQPLLADDAHLFLWVTNAFLNEGHVLVKAWGFRPITVCTWVKTTDQPVQALCETCKEFGCPAHQDKTCKECDWPPRDPLPHGVVRASGRTGYYFRGASEHCIFAVRGSLKLTTKEAIPNVWLWPRTPHSVKPDAFYDLVRYVSPGPYLELWSRSNRLGWETAELGDLAKVEALGHVRIGEKDRDVIPVGG